MTAVDAGSHAILNATRTRNTARKMRTSIGIVVHCGRGCRYRSVAMTALEDVIWQVSDGGPMTLAELQRAAAFLGKHSKIGRMDVHVARVRVAVQLEKLGA